MVRFFFIEVKVRFLNSVFKFAEAEWGVSRPRSRASRQQAALRRTESFTGADEESQPTESLQPEPHGRRHPKGSSGSSGFFCMS